MIRRVIKFGIIGVALSLISWGLRSFFEAFPIGFLFTCTVPALALWYLFKPFLVDLHIHRLLALILANNVVPIVLLVAVFSLVKSKGPPPFGEITMYAALVFASRIAVVPVIFGTPSYLRSMIALMIWVLVYAGHLIIVEYLIRNLDGSGRDFCQNYLFGSGKEMVDLGWVLAALAPDHIAMERAAQLRKKLPNCEKCEYDLTGNVSGVCPECGTAMSEALRQRLLRPRDNARASEFTADQS